MGNQGKGSGAVRAGYMRAKVQRRDELCGHLGGLFPSLNLSLLSHACGDN